MPNHARLRIPGRWKMTRILESQRFLLRKLNPANRRVVVGNVP